MQAEESPKDSYVAPIAVGQPHSCLSYYPKEARENHVSGKITLQFQITAQGSVTMPEIRKSSGDKSLDAAAQECASHWQYRPAMRNGQAVGMKWRANVIFDAGHPDKEKPQTTL